MSLENLVSAWLLSLNGNIIGFIIMMIGGLSEEFSVSRWTMMFTLITKMDTTSTNLTNAFRIILR
jgi:hypothetical protein